MAQRVPGIIVRIVNDTGIIAPPIFERYPTIIGEGDPYRLISDTLMSRTAGWLDPIPTTSNVHEIVSVGDLPGIAKYVDGPDYSLSGNSIHWTHTGSRPNLGDDYYITFTETRPASAFVPMLYFDENLIIADHGGQTRNAGDINDVVVGSSLALNNGAGGVIVCHLDTTTAVDPENPTNAELEDAFIDMRDKLEGITDYKLLLVPLSSGTLDTTTAADIFFNHAVLCSQPQRKQERSVLAAMGVGTTVVQFATYAQTYAHERMVVPATPDGTFYVTGFSSAYDTRHYCAALAGKLCAVPIGRTIHDEIIFGGTFNSNFTPGEQDYLVKRGVSPAKIRGTVVRNIYACTTDTTSALTEDLGVQDIKDYVKKYWREGLWNVYRNAPINDGLLAQLRATSRNIMEFLKSPEQQVISQYKDIVVAQDITEPRKINITGKVMPAYCVGWMDITFTFVLSM